MNRILKRPMFRKGGAVEDGIMKLATGGRAMYANGPGPALDPNDPVLQKARQNKAILEEMTGGTRDIKQDFYDVLISGGMNLAGGVGAGDGTIASIARSFKEPTEKFLAKRPGEEAFQRQIKMAAAQGAISAEDAAKILEKELAGKKEIAAISRAFKEPTEKFLAKRPGEETFKKQLGLAAGQAAISSDSKKTKQDRLLYLSDLKSQIEQKQVSGIKLTPAEENRLKAINIEIFKLDKDPYLKGSSPAAVAQELTSKDGYSVVEAYNIANFRDKYFSGKLDPKIVQSLDPNMPEVSSKEIKVTPQGVTFSETISEKKKNNFQPGKAYFNSSDGQLYLYRGNNKFQTLQ